MVFERRDLLNYLTEINPITDFIGRDLELYLEDYYLDEAKFSETEES